jgi:signal transduction histidine kinase
MRTEEVALAAVAAAASIIALRWWRVNRAIAQRLAKAESDKARLEQALALREREENERICRLEHDLKSPLGAILGFSSLLGEFAEQNHGKLPPVPLKSISGIQQAARKMLQTIEAAVDRKYSHQDREETVAQGKS